MNRCDLLYGPVMAPEFACRIIWSRKTPRRLRPRNYRARSKSVKMEIISKAKITALKSGIRDMTISSPTGATMMPYPPIWEWVK